jgi:hypothetical protein
LTRHVLCIHKCSYITIRFRFYILPTTWIFKMTLQSCYTQRPTSRKLNKNNSGELGMVLKLFNCYLWKTTHGSIRIRIDQKRHPSAAVHRPSLPHNSYYCHQFRLKGNRQCSMTNVPRCAPICWHDPTTKFRHLIHVMYLFRQDFNLLPFQTTMTYIDQTTTRNREKQPGRWIARNLRQSIRDNRTQLPRAPFTARSSN